MAEICSKCGSKMKKDGWVFQWKCPKCGNITINHEDEYSYENLYEDKPDCCIACDGDTYPDCKDGCPLINE